MSKAFDSVSPPLLIKKLESYNFSGSAFNLLRSYFSHRQNRVKLGSVTSQWRNTIRGCPQGSSFGTLLWNSFQNDLAYITEEEISMYADDHQIFASGSFTSIVEGKLLLLSEGSKITRWYKENLLQVNVHAETSIMELGAESETNNINLHIDAVNIKQLKSIKLFCVFLESELNFSEHISFVCKKASQQIGFLRRLRKLIPTHAKITTKQSCHIASLDLLQHHLVFLHAEPQTNVKLKDYRRRPLERFSTMSQSPTTNC